MWNHPGIIERESGEDGNCILLLLDRLGNREEMVYQQLRGAYYLKMMPTEEMKAMQGAATVKVGNTEWSTNSREVAAKLSSEVELLKENIAMGILAQMEKDKRIGEGWGISHPEEEVLGLQGIPR